MPWNARKNQKSQLMHVGLMCITNGFKNGRNEQILGQYILLQTVYFLKLKN